MVSNKKLLFKKAMAKTRKYKYRKTYRRYRQVASRNFFKVKQEYYDKVMFDLQAGNNSYISWNSLEGDPAVQNKQVLTLTYIVEHFQYHQVLPIMFSFWRLLGISVELVPDTTDGKVITNEIPCFLAFKAGTNDGAALPEVKTMNQSILLDSQSRQRRYWKVYGYYGDWESSDSAPAGNFSIRSETQGTNVAQPAWKVKISLYWILKIARV